MRQAAAALLGAGFTDAVCLAAGLLLLRRLRLPLAGQEQWPLGFLLGAALLSTLTLLLGLLGLASWPVFLAVGVALIGLAVWFRSHNLPSEPLPAVPKVWRVLGVLAVAVFSYLYLFNALAPETSADGMAYHLGLVARYWREHRIMPVPTNFYAMLTAAVEMLFLFAFTFGRHAAASLVHLSFLFALAWLMVLYGQRLGRPAVGVAGALLVFASPVVGTDAACAYIDVATAAACFGLFYTLERWRADRQTGWLAASGLLAGFCFATKYTAGIALPYALLAVVVYSGWKRWAWVRSVFVLTACAGVVAGPWLVRNIVWYQNPLAPFFNRLFPNPYMTSVFEQSYVASMRNFGELPSKWLVPWEVTVRGEALNGFVGPVFLLVPLALLAWRLPVARRLLLAALVFGLTYPANLGTRFLIPCLPFLAFALCLALERWRGVLAGLIVAHAVLSWPAVAERYCGQYAWRLFRAPVRVSWDSNLRQRYQEAFVGRWRVMQYLNEQVPAGVAVYALGQLPESYLLPLVRVSYQSGLNSRLHDMLLAGHIEDWQATRQARFRHQGPPVQAVRLVQSGLEPTEVWSLAELRVFGPNRELPRNPNWRVWAWPNPWNVGYAFDNSLATRWKASEHVKPGQVVGVTFGRPTPVREVRITYMRDHWNSKLRLEGQDEKDQWHTLDNNPKLSEAPAPLSLRRAAIEEMQREGIGFLAAHDDDPGAKDLQQRTAEYGMELVAEQDQLRVYRLKR